MRSYTHKMANVSYLWSQFTLCVRHVEQLTLVARLTGIAARFVFVQNIQTCRLWVPIPDWHLLCNQNSTVPAVSAYPDTGAPTKPSSGNLVSLSCLLNRNPLTPYFASAVNNYWPTTASRPSNPPNPSPLAPQIRHLLTIVRVDKLYLLTNLLTIIATWQSNKCLERITVYCKFCIFKCFQKQHWKRWFL